MRKSTRSIAAYKAFGGSPTPISWAETFTALQQGVVDGQCYGYIGFKAMKFNEANQKYLTEVHYTYQLQPLVISERVFKKMTPEMQKLIVDAGKYAQDTVLKFQLENAEAAKKELIAGGLVVSQLEDEDRSERRLLRPAGGFQRREHAERDGAFRRAGHDAGRHAARRGGERSGKCACLRERLCFRGKRSGLRVLQKGSSHWGCLKMEEIQLF